LGVSAFLENLGVTFVCGLQIDDIPPRVGCNDHDALADWLQEVFAAWLLSRREQLMATEWFVRGWAEQVLTPDPSGRYRSVYTVLSECVEQIEAWMEDGIE